MKISKIYKLIENDQKKNFFILLCVIFILGLLEFIGIGTLLPFLVLVSDMKSSQNEILNLIIANKNYFNFSNPILISLIIIFLTFFVKNFFSIFLNYYKNLILKKFFHRTSVRLMRKYFFMDYLNFSKVNTSTKINIINKEVELLVNAVINPFIVSILEILTIIFFLIFIFYFDYKLFLLIFFFVLFISVVFVLFFGKILKTLGNDRANLQNLVQKDVVEALHGIRDIKIFNKENFFLKIFSFRLNKISDITVKYNTLTESQKNLIEFFAVIFFCILVFFLNTEKSNSEILVILGFFLAMFVRLIPTINKLYISAQSIRYYFPSLLMIEKDLEDNSHISFFKKNFDIKFGEIKIRNGFFYYSDHKKPIFRNLNIEIKKNDYLGIFGESGSGKSTFVDILSCILKLKEGSFLLNGKNIYEDVGSWQSIIGYVPQYPYLIDDTVQNNIAFGLDYDEVNKDKIEEILNMPFMSFVSELKNGAKTKIGDRGLVLSGGQKQRIAIARAIYKNAQILIFDESTSSLDRQNEKAIMKVIDDLSKERAIIFISHKFELMKSCKKIYNLTNESLKEI